jgi:hypothetical protein
VRIHSELATQAKLKPVLRRAQLALALILLLVLAPLAGANCGIECIGATSLQPLHAASAQHPCARASACCHSKPVLCGVTSAPEFTAAFVTGTKAPHGTAAHAAIAAESLPQNSRTIAARCIDTSPPGQLRSAHSTPLRV